MTFLKAPHWEWYIVWYFFLGGIAGGAYFVGAIADNFGGRRDEEVAKSGYLVALPLTMICAILLTVDLGTPTRFLNMLGRFRFWNPMSVGSWGIGAFGAFAFTSAVLSFTRDPRLVWLRKNMGKVGSLFGFFLASYTGVLLGSTARPIWTDARFMGALFLASGASTGIAAIGSGGPYAQAAAQALSEHTELSARKIAEEAMKIAGKMCIYTNDQVTIEEL